MKVRKFYCDLENCDTREERSEINVDAPPNWWYGEPVGGKEVHLCSDEHMLEYNSASPVIIEWRKIR